MTTITNDERNAIDDAIKAGDVTKIKAGKARGVNKRTAPMTMTKTTRKGAKAAKATLRATKSKTTQTTQSKTTTQRAAGTFTTVDIAKEQGISAKTLRARIRRNIDDWEALFHEGVKHVFKDNKTTRAKIDALMS